MNRSLEAKQSQPIPQTSGSNKRKPTQKSALAAQKSAVSFCPESHPFSKSQVHTILTSACCESYRLTGEPCTEKKTVHNARNQWHCERVASHAPQLILTHLLGQLNSSRANPLQSQAFTQMQFPLPTEYPIPVALASSLCQARRISNAQSAAVAPTGAHPNVCDSIAFRSLDALVIQLLVVMQKVSELCFACRPLWLVVVFWSWIQNRFKRHPGPWLWPFEAPHRVMHTNYVQAVS